MDLGICDFNIKTKKVMDSPYFTLTAEVCTFADLFEGLEIFF